MAAHVEREGPVTIVVLDRPEVRNAVDRAHAEQLADAFRVFDADPDASVAMLWGAGGTFCAGADLQALAAGDPDALQQELEHGMAALQQESLAGAARSASGPGRRGAFIEGD